MTTKWIDAFCFVPMCRNTKRRTPEKLFFAVPADKKMRSKWCRAAKRDQIAEKSCKWCCEDHFSLENDVENWMRYKIMKEAGRDVFRLKIKKDVVPHIFNCWPNGTQRHTKPPRSVATKRQSAETLSQTQSNVAAARSTDHGDAVCTEAQDSDTPEIKMEEEIRAVEPANSLHGLEESEDLSESAMLPTSFSETSMSLINVPLSSGSNSSKLIQPQLEQVGFGCQFSSKHLSCNSTSSQLLTNGEGNDSVCMENDKLLAETVSFKAENMKIESVESTGLSDPSALNQKEANFGTFESSRHSVLAAEVTSPKVESAIFLPGSNPPKAEPFEFTTVKVKVENELMSEEENATNNWDEFDPLANIGNSPIREVKVEKTDVLSQGFVSPAESLSMYNVDDFETSVVIKKEEDLRVCVENCEEEESVQSDFDSCASFKNEEDVFCRNETYPSIKVNLGADVLDKNEFSSPAGSDENEHSSQVFPISSPAGPDGNKSSSRVFPILSPLGPDGNELSSGNKSSSKALPILLSAGPNGNEHHSSPISFSRGSKDYYFLIGEDCGNLKAVPLLPVSKSSFVSIECGSDLPTEQVCKEHQAGKIYSCVFCPATFKDSRLLTRHLNSPASERSFSCPGIENKRVRNLRMTTHLKQEKPTCPHCGIVCPSNSWFANHLFVHSEKKSFVCPQCGATYKFKHSLRQHCLHRCEKRNGVEVND